VTPFAAILKNAVEGTPNAIGGAFAASDGEMVDSFATIDQHDWAVMTAYYGIVLAHMVSAFDTWHHGSPEFFIAQHGTVDVVVHAVEGGYFALLAFEKPAHLGFALERIRAACRDLRKEMA
jgi:hypothetical protein